MSLHGIGEPFLDMIFRRLLETRKINYIPPNIIKGIDYLITDGTFIFIELEDTVEELYNATVQM